MARDELFEQKFTFFQQEAERRLKANTTNNSNITVEKTRLEIAEEKLGALSTCLDYMWILVCGAPVMFMQAGFAILESGACRRKNAGMILAKNVFDACIGTICWYFIGYGFAYGESENPNGFIGTTKFTSSGFLVTDAEGAITGTHHFKDWFFQWAFCATAATIVSGGVAERIQFVGYMIYSVVMTAMIYPVVVWWTWSAHGWLKSMGYSDFAGSGIVHLTGGVSSLMGSLIAGARKDRWAKGKDDDFQANNLAHVVLGTFFLWFGWYGFNCGSTLSFSDVSTATTASLVAMNTTVSAATGGLTVFTVRFVWSRFHKDPSQPDHHGLVDLGGTYNGILVGLVAVCAGVDTMDSGFAVLTGVLGGP